MSELLEKLAAPTANKPQTLPALLKHYAPRFKTIAPQGVDVNRFSAALMADVRANQKLSECSPMSIVSSYVRAIQMGLEPGFNLGLCYFVPYKGECTLIIGYRGMMELAYRSGKVAAISSRPVYENDHFEVELGTSEKIIHRPAIGDRGSMVAVYAVAKLKDGGTHFEVLDMNDIEKAKRASKASNFGPWKDYPDEMARKTAVRRLFKYLPVSTEFNRAITVDDRADSGASDKDAESILNGSFEVFEGGSDGESS